MLPLKDFYFLNPELSTDCSNLLLGLSYCVAAVGDISTYPGYPATVPATVFPKPTTSSYAPALNPEATGTADNCSQYINYARQDLLETAFGASQSNATLDLNDCFVVALSFQVTVSDLVAWNPSLSKDSCALQPGFSYCVRQDASGNTSEFAI